MRPYLEPYFPGNPKYLRNVTTFHSFYKISSNRVTPLSTPPINMRLTRQNTTFGIVNWSYSCEKYSNGIKLIQTLKSWNLLIV